MIYGKRTATGYFGAFRRSELVQLNVEDIAWEAEDIVITLPRSKTDQQGQGITRAIPFGEGACCPAAALRIWLSSTGIATGPLFRPISKWSMVSTDALHEGSVNTILADCAKLVQLGYVP